MVARGSPLFIRECVFGGTINAQFQSLFCQNVYIYDFGSGKRGENFVFGGLNLHNFRPFFSLTFLRI